MTDNVLPFRKSHRRSPSSDAHRREAEEDQRKDAEQRRRCAEEIEKRLAVTGKRHKRGPILPVSDKIYIAENLHTILDIAHNRGLDRKQILQYAKLGDPDKDSTKFLYQYTFPDRNKSEQNKARVGRLSRVVNNYLKIAKSIGKLVQNDELWFVGDLFRNTSYEVDPLPSIQNENWIYEIRDLVDALSKSAIKRHDGLKDYLCDLSCGYLGWHATCGFGEFESLHLGRPVVIRDRQRKWMRCLGYIPTIHLYDELLGRKSFENVLAFRDGEANGLCGRDWEEFELQHTQCASVYVYRELLLGIAPFEEQRSWYACFEKRLRFSISVGSIRFSTYDPFANVWDLDFNPAIRSESCEISDDSNEFRIEFPKDWIDHVPFDPDFVDESGCRPGEEFYYERVDCASIRKYLGTPDNADNIQLGDWWGDVREDERRDTFFDELEWHYTWDLTKPSSCPLGTIGRAIEQNLIYDSDPTRRLDERLFAAVATKVEEAESKRAELDQDREDRIRDLKRRWDAS